MAFYGMGNESSMIEDALEAGGMAWWLMELPSGAVFFSPNKLKLIGYKESDASKFVHYSAFTNLLHPDDHDKTMKAMRDHIDGIADIYEAKYRIKSSNGEYVHLYDRGRIVAKKGKDIAVAGIVIDLTKYSPGKT
jgi:PAS domain S-box-containing protein